MSFFGDIASSLGSFLGVRPKERSCPVHLQPIIQWPGGKSRLAKKITDILPKHDTYVEPFAGGASVFFHKSLAKKNVISDMDPWLTSFYKDVRNGKLESCEDGILASRGLFDRAKKKKDACNKVALLALSFHGDRKSFGANARDGKVTLKGKLGNHRCYANKLKKATIVRKDFAAVMRENDSKTTVHFLDPPWPMAYSDKYAGGTKAKAGKSRDKSEFGGAMDPKHVKKVADKMKGTVVVIYNWTPELQRTFSGPGWTTKKWSVATGGGRVGDGPKMKPNLVAIKRAK